MTTSTPRTIPKTCDSMENFMHKKETDATCAREADGPLEIEPDPITIVLLNKEPDPIKIVLLNKEPDQIII